MLFKKGDRMDLNNYRTIWLITLISRIVAKVAAIRLQAFAETNNLLPNTQWGFRAFRSTSGPLFLLRVVVELMASATLPEDFDRIVLILVDIRKAYPRVPREPAWAVLANLGVPSTMLSVLQGLHEDTEPNQNQVGSLTDFLFYQRFSGTRSVFPDCF